MVDAAITRRVQEVRNQLNLHNYHYHVLDRPLIPDVEYDALFRELQALEEANPELFSLDSPTQRVGAAPSPEFKEVVHARPMLSLGNAFDDAELAAWHRRAAATLERDNFSMVCEPKIDGLAIALIYERGRFVQGATRGDGARGEDVTPERAHHQVYPAGAAIAGVSASPHGSARRGLLPQRRIRPPQR